MPGIEPGASYMQSMRSTTELHPPVRLVVNLKHNSKSSCTQKRTKSWKALCKGRKLTHDNTGATLQHSSPFPFCIPFLSFWLEVDCTSQILRPPNPPPRWPSGLRRQDFAYSTGGSGFESQLGQLKICFRQTCIKLYQKLSWALTTMLLSRLKPKTSTCTPV